MSHITRLYHFTFSFSILLCLILTIILFHTGIVRAQDNTALSAAASSPGFTYLYKNRTISMVPSPRYVAISEQGTAFKAFISKHGLKRDRLSDIAEIKSTGLGLYRLPFHPADKEKQQEFFKQLSEFSKTTGETVQPVFEQGRALMIPGDRLIMSFKANTGLEEARKFISQFSDDQGIKNIKPLRSNTFTAIINKPSQGRVFEVSRFLAQKQPLRYAEPDMWIFMRDPDDPVTHDKANVNRPETKLHYEPATHHSPVVWTTLLEEGCESTDLPSGWITDNVTSSGQADVLWITTDYRAHAGNRSCYATGGGPDGVPPPGPYPEQTGTWLLSPLLDLSAFEEVYIDLWFYTRIEDPYPYDVGDFATLDILSDTEIFQNSLCTYEATCFTTSYTGDLTADPTTDNGWRHALYRVPPALRQDNVRLRFTFGSRFAGEGEGFYIDQIRVVATSDVDTEPLGNDTYGARMYGFRNAGQIAGLGDYSNDMNIPEAWALVDVSEDIILAVVDSGIDLTHPDLNVVGGYNIDGTPGGEPYPVWGYHGTAVAGNAGAIRNNGIGVFGTAPGVKLLSVRFGNSYSEFGSAFEVAVNHNANIINNSWGWHGAPSNLVEDAIVDALAHNVVLLFAAGNGPDRYPYNYDTAFPANLSDSTDIISVGASSPTDEHKSTSSSDGQHKWGSSYIGAGPDVVAPAPWSYTTDVQGAEGYNPNYLLGSLIDPADPETENYTPTFGGTSSATPKVAGIVALMLSKNPDLTPAEVKQILRDTADDIDVPGIDDKTGAGRVNAEAAVQATPEYIDIPEFYEAIRCFPFCPLPWILIAIIVIFVAIGIRQIRNRTDQQRGM